MRCIFTHILMFLGIGAVLLAQGCADPRTHPSRTEAQYEQDRILAERVREALDEVRPYRFPEVKVTAFEGVVQLSGFVTTPGQRQYAGNTAALVPGVVSVENNLELKGLPP